MLNLQGVFSTFPCDHAMVCMICPAKERAISVLLFFCEATQPRAPSADGVLKSSFVSSAVRSRQPRDVGRVTSALRSRIQSNVKSTLSLLSAGTGKSERLQIDVEHHHTTCYNIKSSISLTDLRENETALSTFRLHSKAVDAYATDLAIDSYSSDSIFNFSKYHSLRTGSPSACSS